MKSNHLSQRLSRSRLSSIFAFPIRLGLGLHHLGRQTRLVGIWLTTSREHTNFTYNITERNRHQLLWFCSNVTGAPIAECRQLAAELLSDDDLSDRIRVAAQDCPRRGIIDVEPRFARRVAWYVLIRILKPSTVVETGTDLGLGAVVLGRALERNGFGQVVTVDTNPESGSLLDSFRDLPIERRVGSSLEIIPKVGPIDFFIHDSDHRAEYEREEFELAIRHGSNELTLLSDNAHVTTVLAEIAEECDMQFTYISEEPESHWWPGDGVGVARPRPFTFGVGNSSCE